MNINRSIRSGMLLDEAFEFSEKPKGYSQQITDFRKSVSHRKFYAPIQQLITDNPLSPPPFLPTSYLPLPFPLLPYYCTVQDLLLRRKYLYIF